MEYVYKQTELPGIVGEFIENLEIGATATVLLLEGDLGAGKTTFTQELAKQMGFEEPVVSPTFVIQKRYEKYRIGWKNKIQIEEKSIDGHRDIEKRDWKEWIKKPEKVVVVEWPDIIKEALPEDHYKLSFSHTSEETRTLNISRHEK